MQIKVLFPLLFMMSCHVSLHSTAVDGTYSLEQLEHYTAKVFYGLKVTNWYSSNGNLWVPSCPFVADYHPTFSPAPSFSIKLKSSEETLPESLQKELLNHDIQSLDIFFHIQPRDFLALDHPYTSLRVHGWVDPDVPCAFSGWRVNQKVWIGLFEPSHPEIGAYEVKEKELKALTVITHDSLMSPDNAHIGLPERKEHNNVSFWSLTLDPEKKKAVATLHWLYENITLFDDANGRPEYLLIKETFSEKNISTVSPEGITIIPMPEISAHLRYKTIRELWSYLLSKIPQNDPCYVFLKKQF